MKERAEGVASSAKEAFTYAVAAHDGYMHPDEEAVIEYVYGLLSL